MSADSAVTYSFVHYEARSWSIPSEDPYEEAAQQLFEQAPHSLEYVPRDHVPVFVLEFEHPEDLVPAEDDLGTDVRLGRENVLENEDVYGFVVMEICLMGRRFRKKDETMEWMNLSYFLMSGRRWGNGRETRWKKKGDTCVVTGDVRLGRENVLENEDVYGFVVMEICLMGRRFSEKDETMEWMNLSYFLMSGRRWGNGRETRWKKRGDTCVVTG
nr:hypothetical protein [Tanacetum cinerariifolium]